jgi:hypothetical protein
MDHALFKEYFTANQQNIVKLLPKMVLESIHTNKVLLVPKLARKFTMAEAALYNSDVLEKRPKFVERIQEPTTGTCYRTEVT